MTWTHITKIHDPTVLADIRTIRPPRLGESRLRHTILEDGSYLLVVFENNGDPIYVTFVPNPY